MKAPALLTDLTEKDWQRQVVELAVMCGWRKAYHTFDSRRSHPGFPDLVLVRDRVLFIELKAEKGKLSDVQRDWLRALLEANAEAYVARPRDLDEIGAVLGPSTAWSVQASARLDRQLREKLAA